MQNQKTRHSLSRRITIQIALLMVIMALAVSYISYRSLKSTYLRLYNEKAQDVVRMLSSEIDGDRLEAYVKTGETDEYYDWLKSELDKVLSEFTGIQYLYVFHPEEGNFTYIVDGLKAGDDPAQVCQLGDSLSYGEKEYALLVEDIRAGRASTELIQGQDVGYGQTISAWAPVFDSAGKVVGMVEADCILSNLNSVVRGYASRIIGVTVLCILVVLFLALRILEGNVTKPIGQLTEMVDSYEHGTFSETKFKHNDEVQWLASSFTEMTQRIAAYTDEVAQATAEKERMSAEFNVARQIQSDILPNEFPAFPDRAEFDIVATMEPSQEIGGDFYDYFLVDDDHLALVVGDVADKGIPAALFMVIVKTLIKNRALEGYSPAEVLQSVSEQLLEGNQASMFSRVWFALLELSTGKGMAANAGNTHPVLCRAGKRFELQEYQHSPPVGAIEGVRFHDHGFQLSPGDTLFVYTDGLTDAVNEQEDVFGEARILEALNREPDASASVLLQTMKQSVEQFSGSVVQIDDVTMLALNYYGTESPEKEWQQEAEG